MQDTILDLYDNNHSISRISKIVKLSPYKVRKIILQLGRTVRQHNYQDLGIDDKANELYNSGLSTCEIAEILGCSDETVRRKIKSIRSVSDRNRRSRESRQKISESCKAKWQDDEYKARVFAATNTEKYKAALSVAAKHHDMLANWNQSEAGRKAISDRVKKLWQDDEYFAKQSVYFAENGRRLQAKFQENLKDPKWRAAWLAKLSAISVERRANQPKISSSQAQLYYILENSGISYYEEGVDTKVGPFYVVDCIIPRQQNMERDLIIEVQGEYWHSLNNVKTRDKQKRTYVRRHTNFDMMYLKELDLKSWDTVCCKLDNYGLTLATINCKPADLTIYKIDESQAALFYSIFHYSCSIRKGAITFGVYYQDALVACISYTYPIRNEVSRQLGYSPGEVLEISRLARATNLQCKNLISWFIARTKKLLPINVKVLVSFSDSTYGHTGITYKACGFDLDGSVGKNYHYESATGRYHKRTIWDKSKRFKMSESEYATTHGLTKVADKEKTRWVLKLT